MATLGDVRQDCIVLRGISNKGSGVLETPFNTMQAYITAPLRILSSIIPYPWYERSGNVFVGDIRQWSLRMRN